MPRRSYPRRMPSSKPTSNIKQPTKYTPKQPQVVSDQPKPSVMGTLGQGMAIGAGAAVGSTLVNGAIDMLSTKEESPKQNKNFNCQAIMESFQNCMYSRNDIELCKPQLELFNNCIKEI